MRYIVMIGLALLLILQCPAAAFTSDPMPLNPKTSKRIHSDKAPKDSAETSRMWNTARRYKSQMRYELARQYYLLALSTARSNVTVERIQRELQIVELQIRSLR